MTLARMMRLLVLLFILTLAVPAIAREGPGKSQRRAPGGMTASNGVAELSVEIYGATPPEGGWPPLRYFSRRLQARIAVDRARPVPRVAADWLRRPGQRWPAEDFHAWVLNTTGGSGDRPTSAMVSLGFDGQEGWGRRLRLIDEGGYWVIDGVCLFPETLSLDDILDRPVPTEPGHEAAPDGRRSC